jgi:hypothetical protein
MPPNSVHQGVNDRAKSFTPFTVDEGVNVTIANPLKMKASPRERLGRRFPIRSPSPLFPFPRRGKGDRWVSDTVLNIHCQSVQASKSIAPYGVQTSTQNAEDESQAQTVGGEEQSSPRGEEQHHGAMTKQEMARMETSGCRWPNSGGSLLRRPRGRGGGSPN